MTFSDHLQTVLPILTLFDIYIYILHNVYIYFGYYSSVVPNKWNREFFTHTYEGDDDMPGHVKSSLVGASITLPWHIKSATYDLYVCEHRDVGGWGGGHNRKVMYSIYFD